MTFRKSVLYILVIFLASGCSSTKKKGEVSKLGRFFHNTTAKYNGYFNANEILKESIVTLESGNQDNYNELLNVYAYQGDNPQVVASELDRAIEKVSTVVTLHRPSKWVDDCYLLLGKAQYLKQDYESAEETFKFFQEEFDPLNPYSGNYEKNRKKSSKEKKKVRDEVRKENKKEKKIEKEERDDAREEKAKERKQSKKEDKKAREESRKKEDKLKSQIKNLREKLRKEEKKRKDKEKEAVKKARKKKKRIPKKDPKADRRSAAEKTVQSKLDAKQAELDVFRAEKNKDKVKKDEKSSTETEPEIEVDNSPTPEEEAAALKAEEEKKAKEEEEAELKKADEKAKKARERKNKEKPTPPSGLLKHKPAYYEGLLWLAKTYAERDNKFSSEYLLRTLEEEPGVYEKVASEIPAAYAHLYITQKDYEKAVPALERAIVESKDKKKKARYAYILGQIYERNGENEKALIAFAKSKDFKPAYEMSFNAELKSIQLSNKTGKISTEAVVSKLEKMLKEAKNDEYLGQIYYVLGDIELDNNKIPSAIGYFQQSLAQQDGDKGRQVNIYHKLASLFYTKEKYVPSSSYYDSTLQVITKEDVRYVEVEKRSKNLKSIADNIQIIEQQDSMLRLSTMSDAELRAIAEKILEERAVAAESGEVTPVMNKPRKTTFNRSAGGSRSNFFAYNPVAVSQGAREFKRKWGERPLEDNWRRSSKDGGGSYIDTEEEENKVEEEDNSDAEIAALLSNIPKDPADKKIAESILAEAMFNLGVDLRNNLSNYKKSVETLEALLTRFPDYENKVDAYYYLYLSHKDLGNSRQATKYAKLIQEAAPDSDYAKLINDPTYVESLVADDKKLENYYRETYQLFEQGSYSQAKQKIDQVDQVIAEENTYKAKFDLLNAMCIGSLEGKEKYILALKDVSTKYPNTPEKTRANEILRFLGGNKDAFNSELVQDEKSDVFKTEDAKLHYAIIVLYDLNDKDLSEVKISINDYNKKYHKVDKLRITTTYLNIEDKTQIVLIRKFDNKEKVMAYHDLALKQAKQFVTNEKYTYDLYAVTQRNFREIVKQRTAENYRSFFEKNYLGR